VAACGSDALPDVRPLTPEVDQRGYPIKPRPECSSAILATVNSRYEVDFEGLLAAVRRGERVDCGRIEDLTPLDWAVVRDRPDMVRVLLEAGADPNARWSRSGDRFPLQEAIESQPFGGIRQHRREIIKLLLQHGADPNQRWCPFESRGGAPPLMPACESDSGTTPLLAAAWLDQADTTYLLLDAGADPALQDGRGKSALDDASGRVVFELLVAAQFRNAATRRADAIAYLNGKVAPGRTALGEVLLSRGWYGSWVSPPPPQPPPTQGAPLVAVQPESEPRSPWVLRAELLLSLGANPNDRLSGEADWTTLAIAATNGDEQAARVLLAHGANPNARWCVAVMVPFETVSISPAPTGCVAERGTTPLIVAAQYGHDKVVRELLQSGADPTLRDWQNKTARDYAVELKRGFVLLALDGKPVLRFSTGDAPARIAAPARGSRKTR
jgi:ankyrin repeat protein